MLLFYSDKVPTLFTSWKDVSVLYWRPTFSFMFSHTRLMGCKPKRWGGDQTTLWPASSAMLTTMGFPCSCIHCFSRSQRTDFNSPGLKTMFLSRKIWPNPASSTLVFHTIHHRSLNAHIWQRVQHILHPLDEVVCVKYPVIVYLLLIPAPENVISLT